MIIVALFTIYTEFDRFQTAIFEKFTVDHGPCLVPFWVEQAITLGLAVAALSHSREDDQGVRVIFNNGTRHRLPGTVISVF